MGVDVAAAGGPTSAGERRSRERRRRGAAFGLSLLFHMLFAFLMFGALSGGRLAGGPSASGGEARAITVTLAGLRGAPRQASASQPDALTTLFNRIRDAQSTVSATDRPRQTLTDADKLFDVVEPDSPDPDRGKGGRGKADVDQGGRGATRSPEGSDAAASGAPFRGHGRAIGPGADNSAGSLWGQIEPCWARLPNVSAVPVTLDIALNDQGAIALPPKIIRPTRQPPDEKRLIAEARALAAIRACVPYRPAAGPGLTQSYRVEFGATG